MSPLALNRTLCIIPARAGSRRIPGKNMKPFFGKPIIQYSIEKALESDLFDEVVVSTDSIETAEFAERFGVAGVLRPRHLAEDAVGTQEVASNLLNAAGQGFDLVCVIYATAPLMSLQDLRRGYEILSSDPALDYVFSVTYDHLTDGGWQYTDVGQFYWNRAAALLEGKPLSGPTAYRLPISPHRACDINTPEDWALAERLFLALPENRDSARKEIGHEIRY